MQVTYYAAMMVPAFPVSAGVRPATVMGPLEVLRHEQAGTRWCDRRDDRDTPHVLMVAP
jgi:hypothetical protein